MHGEEVRIWGRREVGGLRRCIQKFPDWPTGARTANGTDLCHYVQLYRYYLSQSSECCRHNPLCCSSRSVYCCKRIFRYDSVRKLLDKPSYLKVLGLHSPQKSEKKNTQTRPATNLTEIWTGSLQNTSSKSVAATPTRSVRQETIMTYFKVLPPAFSWR
jgi:hypothetical protein